MCVNETIAPADAGLSVAELSAILAGSIAVFLLWGGPLWLAPAGSSHVARIGISYLVVVPAVQAALIRGGRSSAGRLATATLLLWAVKLVVTSTLYALLVSGGAERYAPVRSWEKAPEASAPGRWSASPAPRVVRWTIQGGRHDEPVHRACPGDAIEVVSRDPELHTLRLSAQGRALANLPLVRDVAPRQLPAPPPGTYEISCDNHAGERATLIVDRHGDCGRPATEPGGTR